LLLDAVVLVTLVAEIVPFLPNQMEGCLIGAAGDFGTL
jgi:hypothetical protein